VVQQVALGPIPFCASPVVFPMLDENSTPDSDTGTNALKLGHRKKP
jgi:hypothetical protein